VSAPDIEELVRAARKERFSLPRKVLDRDLIRIHVERIVVQSNRLAVTLRPNAPAQPVADVGILLTPATTREMASVTSTELTIPFAPNRPLRKGVLHAPADPHQTIDAETQATLLKAIARSRRWMDALLSSEVASLDEIAAAEGLVDRHVRFLAPLAFLSPRIVAAIADGSARAGLTVSGLARTLPHDWAAQEQLLGLG
jgi:site-specific DNA recombinase